jgi:hypothetical protein
MDGSIERQVNSSYLPKRRDCGADYLKTEVTETNPNEHSDLKSPMSTQTLEFKTYDSQTKRNP